MRRAVRGSAWTMEIRKEKMRKAELIVLRDFMGLST
jgi:hypothetical protein|tara:strand:- start:1405 stop:1512 length:108 start_codon:yes stop_codon:yes gene_type:complete